MDLRRHLFERLCRQHGVRWTYVTKGFNARAAAKRIEVPPPYTDATLAICLHELAHCLIPRCPGKAPHWDRRRDGVAQCLACERGAWESAKQLARFSEPMYAELKRCLSTYRERTPAYVDAQEAADRQLGVVAALEEVQRRERWKLRWQRNRSY
jgi:hypothetical protein